MDVNSRAASVSVGAKDPTYCVPAPVEPIVEKEPAFTPVDMSKTPESSILLDPRFWLTKLSAGKSPHEYPPGARIFSQGDPALAVFYVQSGQIQLSVQSEDGEEAVICIHSEGSFLGECCLAGQTVRYLTASAVKRSTVVRVEKQAMMDLLRRDPEFAERFLSCMLSRGACMEADLLSGLSRSSGARLAPIRSPKAGFGSEWKPIPVTAMMGPESLARVVGTTSSNVNLLLDGFRELGFIDSRGDEMLVHSSLMSIVPRDDGIR